MDSNEKSIKEPLNIGKKKVSLPVYPKSMIYYYKQANEESLDLFQLEEVWQDGENVTNKVDLGKFFDSDKDVEKYITHVLGVDVIRKAEADTSPEDLDWEDSL